MGKHSKNRAPLAAVALGGFTGLTALTLGAAPAFAAGNCAVTPGHTEVIHHAAVTHQGTKVIPGQDAQGFDLQRWTKDVPATPAVTQEQIQVSRQHPGSAAVTHEENRYDRVVPGTPAVTQEQIQVSRQHPGSAAVTHEEYQFSRQNPGSAEKSHMEYQFSQTTQVKEYKYALESKTVTYTGSNPYAINWLNANSSSHSGNQWTLKTSVLEAAHFDWTKVARDGNVSLSVYGGPNVTVSYHINPESQVSDWTTSTTSTIPGGYLVDTKTVNTTVYRTASGGSTTDSSQAGWFTQSSFSGWTQSNSKKVVDQAAVAPYTEYKTNDGATSDPSKADWFTQSSFSGWTQSNHRTVTDKAAVDPYTVYRAQDGSTTTNVNDAGWFPEDQLSALQGDGWSQFGDAKSVVVTPATPDVTYYLVVSGATHVEYRYSYHFSEGGHTVTLYYDGTPDGTDNEADAIWVNPAVTTVGPQWSPFDTRTVKDPGTTFTESTNKDDASWINPDTTTVDKKWTSFDTRTVTDKAAVDPYTVYRAQDGSTTTNVNDAGWFPEDQLSALQSQGWDQVGESKSVVITPAQPGYTEYYVHGGEPSKTLTDANWTTDTPKGWKLVDKKHVVTKEAVPPKTISVTVTDKAAWDQTVTTPAQSNNCPVAKTGLAETGFDATPWIVLGTIVVAGGVVITLVARRRREDGDEA